MDSSNGGKGLDFQGTYMLEVQDPGVQSWYIRTSPVNKLETKKYQTNFDNTRKLNWFATQGYVYNVDPQVRGDQYLMLKSDDFSEITITRLHDGMADGTFVFRLNDFLTSHTAGSKKIEVTNGTFRNIRIYDRR